MWPSEQGSEKFKKQKAINKSLYGYSRNNDVFKE